MIMKYFRRGIVTNNFLTPADYRAEIAEGRLYYTAGDSLVLYVRRDGFYNIYFYATPELGLGELPKVRLICEASKRSCEILKRQNAVPIFDRLRLEYTNNTVLARRGAVFEAHPEASAVYSLLSESFDAQTAFLPTLTQLSEECENGFVRAYPSGGAPKAVLRYGVSGKKAVIKHLCVSKNARGKGLARGLLETLIGEHDKCEVHTSCENSAASSLYKSLGFYDAGAVSTVYSIN